MGDHGLGVLIFGSQDVAADRAHGVKSVPARFGVPAALYGARVCHVITTALLACTFWLFDMLCLWCTFQAFGYTIETINFMLLPLLRAKKDPIGSMGDDAALASYLAEREAHWRNISEAMQASRPEREARPWWKFWT